ncbi:DUF1127 domain-containing protein [Roseovarius aquimarinus]|uniref:DUF1127 domain-containing protein n=1 Tax=Roseovarius aquimarinus TaxID=1229156 RepID=A0ABW7I4J5_9RHOB
MTSLSRTRPVSIGALPRIKDALVLARSRRALADLDAAALEDVGLGRAEALREARRPIWDMPCGWPRCRK